MRILFDARVLDSTARHGIARHAAGLLRALGRRPGGHQYLVLARDREVSRLVGGRPGFEVVSSRLKPYSPAELLGLPGILFRLRPELYYSPTFMPPLLSPCPLVLTIHDLIHLDFRADYPWSRRLAWQGLIGPRARRAAAVLTGSRTAADQISRRLGVAEARIEVIGHGLEEAFRLLSDREIESVRAGLGLAGPYFVALGNPRRHKNLAGAVRAFQILAGQGFTGALVLVGAGGLELPAGPGRVVRAGGLGDDELAALLGGALASVFPSLAEGFGLPPLEALACGCPVIAFDLPVLREVLGQAAFFAPLGRTEALAELMGRLAAEPGLGRARAEAGRLRAAEHTWDRAAERLRRVFDRLEAGGGRLAP